MKNLKHSMAFLTAATLLLSGCTAPAAQTPAPTAATPPYVSLEQAQQHYLSKVDVDYSFQLAQQLSVIRDNEALGYRTAGSPAELATGDLLKEEMARIGLTDVTKEPFTLDTWTFETAQLTYLDAQGAEHTVALGGYQTNLDTQGPKEYNLVYGGQSTPADLEGLDITGKLVLVDINQRDNWWINYPAYEASLHGAAAVVAAQDGGYGEVSPDALNTQDICGPKDAPALSISRTDADRIIAALEAGGAQEATVTLNAKSTVTEQGQSFNIVGTIPGRDTESMVLMSAHYDSYFEGFQDDNAAIALMLGIAKGIVDSGYQPEKTLVFCALAAEEWGATNTRYDWSTGAFNQIFRVHPEWAGKVVADINFELPAMSEGDTDQIRTAYELRSFTEGFAPKVPAVEGIFPGGIEVITPTYTWSDDFSFSIAGIPANVTALRGGFSRTHYHSQFDSADTYSREAFLFHHNMYGMLMLEYDRCAVSPLNFTTRLEALEGTVDAALFSAAGVDAAPLTAALVAAKEAARGAYAAVEGANSAYRTALDAGDLTQADTLLAEYQSLSAETLALFKYCEDQLVRLGWEDAPIFPHEHGMNNYAALAAATQAAEAGDAATALDEYLYLVDNNWYAYDWSRETFDYFTGYVLDQPADRLYWGAGRVQGHEDLYDVIAALQAQYGVEGADLSAQAAQLAAARDRQADLLRQQVAHETETVNTLTQRLEALSG